MFGRAFARAGLPLRYSQGFNPHPRFSLPLPRSVGVASDAERLVVELTHEVPCNDLTRRLQQQMPRGIRIHDARLLAAAERCRPTHVRYRIPVPPSSGALLQQAVDQFLASDSAPVERSTGETTSKRVDIRPFVDQIEVTGADLILALFVTADGTARPTEVCTALGIPLDDILGHVRRIEVTWQ
jgi:radical SAM-linked protein